MFFANPRRLEWLLAAIAVLVCAAAAVLVTAQPSSPEPTVLAVATASPTPDPTPDPTPLPTPVPPTPAPLPSPTPPAGLDPALAAAVTTKPTVGVRQAPHPAAPVISRLRAGIVLPVTDRRRTFVRVLTPCEVTGWVSTADLVGHARTTAPPTSLDDAVFVIDPGHGGMQRGAVGPNGLREADANLGIAHRLLARLHRAKVFMTRDADFTAGLNYRTRLASALGAHALLSIHNNSMPDGPSKIPGTETWHQHQSAPALRLAQLVQGELVEALNSFKINWVADHKAGTRTRLNAHGQDYYGLLRGSTAPTVIVEAMFISNAPEANLLASPDGQEAVAAALARVMQHFADTAEPDIMKPYAGAAGTGGGVPVGCVDPT